MRQSFVVPSTLALCVLLAGCSSSASSDVADGGLADTGVPDADVPDVNPQVGDGGTLVAQMNDLSILLPLATTQADFDAYLPASAAGIGGALVPQGTFTTFNVPGMTAIGPGAPELAYSSLRVVAVRLDPCFAQIGPITDAAGCTNQLRVIFQSLAFASGATTAEDSGLHAFYALTRKQLTSALEEIIELRKASGGDADLGPLAVHPLVAQQGLSGAMGTGLAKIIQKYAGTSNLTRLTRLYSSSDTWDFNGIDIAGGKPTPMIIPTLRLRLCGARLRPRRSSWTTCAK